MNVFVDTNIISTLSLAGGENALAVYFGAMFESGNTIIITDAVDGEISYGP